MATDTLYETDFVAWTERQASALRDAARQGSNLPVDWENVAEEIESVGRSERREMRSLVRGIISHLLKLALSPAERPRDGWETEIAYMRSSLEGLVEASPSLNSHLADIVASELKTARQAAARSLRKYGEDDAAERALAEPLHLTAENVIDPGFFLPGTVFRREPD